MTARPLPPGIRRKGDCFEARWYDAAGRRHSATFDTAAAADAYRQEQRRARRRGGSGDPTGGRTTLADWWATYMAGRAIRSTTLERDSGYARNHLLPALGGWRLGDLRPSGIAEWVAGLTASGLAPATVAKHLVILRACLQAAVAEGLLDVNPAAHVKAPAVPTPERRFLLPDELAAIEAQMPAHWAVIVPFDADTGLRIGELAALRVKAVNVVAGTVTVTEGAVGVTRAVTGATTRRQLHEPKTASGRRTVPTLTRSTGDRVAAQIAERGLGPDDLLFAGERGGPLDPNNWRARVWRPAVMAAGLDDPQPTPHALRHSAVALWIAAGVTDPLRLARFAGHASVSTTYNLYGHLLPENADPTREALEGIRRTAQVRPRGTVANINQSQRR